MDAFVAASAALVERMATFGRSAQLLTHGVALEHWTRPGGDELLVLETLPRPYPQQEQRLHDALECNRPLGPVLCTRAAAIPNPIHDGENELVVEGGAVDALSEEIRRLLSDGALRQRLCATGRDTVERSHNFRQRMEPTRAIYDQTLHGLNVAA